MEINIERLKRNIENLGRIGYEKNIGVTRLAYSESYWEGVEYVKSVFIEAGLSIYLDSVGNLVGHFPGKSEDTIMVGSHLDTVPGGGILDGALGVLSGVECIHTMLENHYENNHSFEIIAFIEEEGNIVGGTFGSKCMAGEKINESYLCNLSKTNLSQRNIIEAKRDLSNLRYYVELHIEQGGILECENNDIGIIEGIVGIHRYHVKIEGVENHSGTTPMYLRDDALVKAARLICRFDLLVRKMNRDMVGTIGIINVKPGAVNIIPGQVELIIEMRDKNASNMDQVIKTLIEEYKKDKISFDCILREESVVMDGFVQSAIQKSCEYLNYSYKKMYSGAGHDSIILSKIVPTGMIFIPSIKGISHSQHEMSKWSDIKKGTKVLLDTLLVLDSN